MAGTDGLLIVNADDWGLRSEITDAILEVHRAGRVTSATAMVHMEDTARAATLANDHGVALGLHLNLTFPYTGSGVPGGPQTRQARLARYFARPAARLAYDPRMRRIVNDCVQDQLDAFLSTYGRTPTHVDGHQHIHLCPTVALSTSLAQIPRARPAHTYRRGERGPARLALRAAQNALLRHRFRTARAFLPLEDVHPDLGGRGLGRLDAAARASLEVMTHPQRPAQRAALLGAMWGDALARYRTGTYAEL